MFIAWPAALIPFLCIKAPPTVLLFPAREEPITRLTCQISHFMNKYGPKVGREKSCCFRWNASEIWLIFEIKSPIHLKDDPALYPQFFATTVLPLYNISFRSAGSTGRTRGSRRPRSRKFSKLQTRQIKNFWNIFFHLAVFFYNKFYFGIDEFKLNRINEMKQLRRDRFIELINSHVSF